VKADYDVAIVGSGFSGSLLAMIARRLGCSAVLIERGSHPRFAIGESSTPLANLLLENLATTYDLPRLRPLCEWGSWQKTHPELACGLKRGFTFFHHEFHKPWSRRPDHANQLLVAASPHDAVADTHWYRADFDHFLLREAQALGAECLDQTQLASASHYNGGLHLEGTRAGRTIEVRARFVVDASGPRGFLHRALNLPARQWPEMPAVAGLYSHFSNVRRWDELYPEEATPYPVDDAAVHHVFPGGWIWVLRFNNGITSAGVAAASALQLDPQEGWGKLLKSLPAVHAQFADASPLFPLVHAANLPFRCGTVAGPNWALMPSAAGFIDPLLSTGFPLTLLGIQRLGEVLRQLKNPAEELEHYQRITLAEIDSAASLIGALYRNMDRPQVFNVLTLLYFAAASFTEAACRLRKPQLAGKSFLLGNHTTFAPAFGQCIQLALDRADPQRISKHVVSAIEPIDIAGLSDFSRRNSYGVLASDLREAAHKLHATGSEIDEMLSRCGFIAK
jgi:tetracycline 7-halogenase / FADH2 O2-dependent halogenase